MKTMRHHDRLLSRRKNTALGLLVALCVFALLYGPVRVAVSEMIYTTAPGIWTFGGKAGDAVNSFFGSFRIKRSLVYENETLKEEVRRMQAQVLDRNLLEEKVIKLEEIFGRAGSDNRVVARVLAGAGLSPYDTLIIDAGSEYSIAVGDRVVYAGAGVIGEIVEVYENSSKINLYSYPGEERAVFIGPHGVPATARGRGMGNYEAKVPQGSLITIGDEVRMSGGALILGLVGGIEGKPADPVTRVLFRSSFNIAEIASVEVITRKK